jgi:ABC-2 type transport system permease protein
MNWKTFGALLRRDAHVARRNLIPLILQTMLQPMLFVFVFGQVMTRSGMMQQGFQNIVLPGVMAIAMLMTGIQAVAMPLIAEFQFTREIEDRLLAPIDIHWVAVEKIVAGMLQAVVSGGVVAPAAWLILGRNVGLTFDRAAETALMVALVALLASSAGLLMGASVGQTQIGLLFSLVLAPMIMFGCAYYPWSALESFPIVQKLVLVNPLVYASEGLRGTLTPQVPHMPVTVVFCVLAAIDAALIGAGVRQFLRKAVG